MRTGYDVSVKWHTLSEAGVLLIGRLAQDSRVWLGRRRKMVRSLRQVAVLGEPAAISAISYYLYDDDSAVAEEAALAVDLLLTAVSAELLPTLDQRIRSESYYGFQNDRWRVAAVPLAERFRGSRAYASALCIASCHASGYVRQAAVERLDREITSGVEIPFLLLRLDDWVAVVRQAAEQAVAHRLSDSDRQAYLKLLPLIAQMRSRLRTMESAALASIDDLLRADVKALVDGALASESRRGRRFGLSLALALSRGVKETEEGVLERVIRSKDPAARLQLACWLAAGNTLPELQRQLIPRLLDDRVVAVRRVALGWCATREPGNHVATLRAALLDPSALIRSIAQFHLPKIEPIDLRHFYRAAVTEFERRLLKAALGGLGETGRSTDADLVVRFLDAPEPKIRRAALGALAKLALETHLEIFVDALQSSSAGVSRQARIALDRHAQIVGAGRLEAIFAEARHAHVRRQALSLINQLPKWQKLPLLIEIFGGSDESIRKVAENFLRNWLANYNRTHNIQPTKAEVARIRRAMDAQGLKLEGRLRLEFGALVKSL